MLIRSDYVEGLISKMRNIHKSTPPSFRRRENAAAIVKAPPLGINFKNGPTPDRGAVPNPAKRRRHAFSAVAFLAVLAVGLLFLLPGGLLQAQDDGTIEYAENGTDPVATYTAVDPEMTAIASWSLGGNRRWRLRHRRAACSASRSRPTTRWRLMAAHDDEPSDNMYDGDRPGHGQHRQDRHEDGRPSMVTDVDEPGNGNPVGPLQAAGWKSR